MVRIALIWNPLASISHNVCLSRDQGLPRFAPSNTHHLCKNETTGIGRIDLRPDMGVGLHSHKLPE